MFREFCEVDLAFVGDSQLICAHVLIHYGTEKEKKLRISSGDPCTPLVYVFLLLCHGKCWS